MRSIAIISLLWVIAVLAVHGWNHWMRSVASGEVEKWGSGFQEAIDRDFPRE